MSRTILCIEDNADNADNALIIKSILLREGHTVHIAENGDKGIELAKKHVPDLIICDFHLPGDNAPLVIKKIREHRNLHAIPIIMLTADVTSGPESLELGISAFLNKPIIPDQLMGTVNKVLG